MPRGIQKKPQGGGQQQHVADDGGAEGAGRNAAEAAAGDVESAQSRLGQRNKEHGKQNGDCAGEESHPAGNDQAQAQDDLRNREGGKGSGSIDTVFIDTVDQVRSYS